MIVHLILSLSLQVTSHQSQLKLLHTCTLHNQVQCRPPAQRATHRLDHLTLAPRRKTLLNRDIPPRQAIKTGKCRVAMGNLRLPGDMQIRHCKQMGVRWGFLRRMKLS
jgi:hypothetical protein